MTKRAGYYDPKPSFTAESYYKNPASNIGDRAAHLQFQDPLDYATLNPLRNASMLSSIRKEDDYELSIEFELRREREKNKILQVRLKNKETLILQMKDYQDQLASAFQKCKQDLDCWQKKGSPPDVREYLEEINELKHLVIRLEEQIRYLEKNNRHFKSVKEEVKDAKEAQTSNRGKRKDKRSKTTMNRPEDSPEFKKDNSLSEYILSNSGRVGSFITQFVAMVECFSEDAAKAKAESIKKRMKIGWKWAKQVVLEWNQLRSKCPILEKCFKQLRREFSISDGLDLKAASAALLNACRTAPA